jgi:phosphoserine phosphatase RsbU/P
MIREELSTDLTSLELENRQLRKWVERLTTCAEVSRLINSTLEMEEVLDRIMATSRATMQADVCSLMLWDEESQELVFQVAQGAAGEQLKGNVRLKKGQGIAGHVFETGQPLLIEDAYKDPRFHPDVDRKTGYRTRSILCVPLMVKERIIGVSQAINRLDGAPFTLQDLETFALLCMHAAVAIENARVHRELLRKQRIESDLAFATTVQKSFLPQDVPSIPGLRFRSHYHAALDVGGDFYDFLPLTRGRLGVLIGDVSGKGVSSALYMARLMSDFRFYAMQNRGPAQVVGRINDLLCERSQRGMFVTILYLVLNIPGRTIQYVNAGHLPPLLWNSSARRFHRCDGGGGPPAGIIQGRRYRSSRLSLRPGDCLVLATDGLVEAKDQTGEPFGWERLEGAMRNGDSVGDAVLGRIMGTLRDFVSGAPPSDDVTMVVLGVDEV